MSPAALSALEFMDLGLRPYPTPPGERPVPPERGKDFGISSVSEDYPEGSAVGLPMGNGWLALRFTGPQAQTRAEEHLGLGPLPKTLTMHTGETRQLLFRVPEGLRTRTGTYLTEDLDWECDVRGADGHVMASDWAPGLSPVEVSAADLPRPWREAVTFVEHPEAKRKQRAAPGMPPELQHRLQRMNEDYFVLDYHGDIVVGRNVKQEVARGDTRDVLQLYQFQAFRKKFETELVQEPGRRRQRSIAEAWLSWPGRRQYDRLTFDPSGRADLDPMVLNLWRGWAVEPKPGAPFPRIREHVESVICGGDARLAAAVWGWLASLVQHPDEPAEVALVLKGREGVGKSVLGSIVRKLCGQHGKAVAEPSHLVGNFNAHLRDVVFLEASEAVFAGDRQANSKLKALITDDTIPIEGKGRDVIHVPNFLHILMTSNENWVVPASAEARRYLVVNVSDAKMGDRSYFRALWDEAGDSNALGGLLCYLQTFDLSRYDKRQVVETEGLREQRERSASGVLAWALDLASRGEVQGDFGREEWRPFFPTRLLFEDFRRWVQQPGNRYEKGCNIGTFGRDLRAVLGLKHYRRALAEHAAPPRLCNKPGFAFPKSAEELGELARAKGGFRENLDGVEPEQASSAPTAPVVE